MRTTSKIAGSVLAFGLIAGNAFAELPVGLEIKAKQKNTWGTLEGDNWSKQAYEAKGYGLEVAVQPMKTIPVAISAEFGFSTASDRFAKISGSTLEQKADAKWKKTGVDGQNTQGNYSLEETVMLSAWVPTEMTGTELLRPTIAVGYSFAQVTNVYSVKKAAEKIKEGEDKRATKEMTGSNNGFNFRFANVSKVSDSVSFELAYDLGLRKLNLESEKDGLTMTEMESGKNNDSKPLKDTRDNTSHTVSLALNVNI
jgi:hypothetical protein